MATTISRTWYDTLVDDSGSGTDGTILDKADFDAILDAIDAIFAGHLVLGGNLTVPGTFPSGVTLAAGTALTEETGNDLILNVPTNRSLLIKVNGVTKNTMDLNGNWLGLSLAAGFALTEESGNDLILNVPSTRALLIKVNNVTKLTMDNAGALTLSGIPAFVASDKYLVVDASGNVHKSALGPAS